MLPYVQNVPNRSYEPGPMNPAMTGPMNPAPAMCPSDRSLRISLAPCLTHSGRWRNLKVTRLLEGLRGGRGGMGKERQSQVPEVYPDDAARQICSRGRVTGANPPGQGLRGQRRGRATGANPRNLCSSLSTTVAAPYIQGSSSCPIGRGRLCRALPTTPCHIPVM